MRDLQPRGASAEQQTTKREPGTDGARSESPASPLRSMDFAAGEAFLAPSAPTAPIQARAEGGGANLVGDVAARGVQGGGQAAPHLGAVQQAFGRHDVGDVQAHVGGAAGQAAASMGAEAYATGNNVAFGKSPDLHTAAHEYAHVVQQRAGVSLPGGVGRSGDRYEQHADQVASLVVQGKSAEGKLDEMAGGGGGGAVQKRAVQRKGKPVIEKVDAATIAKLVAFLRGSAAWAAAVANYRALTQGGKQPLERGPEDDIFLELLVAVEGAWDFAEGVTIDALLDDVKARSAMIGAVKKDATPEPPAPEKPKVEIPPAGSTGMVSADTELTKADGSKVALKTGDAIESQGPGADGMLKVLVHSGKEVEGTIDPKLFKSQPRISTDDNGKADTHTYQQYEGKLFLGEPSVMDVDQGALGDCYLISGMGAVAAANPEIIKNALKDNGDGTFTVTFWELQKDGKSFKPHYETVDNYLPSYQGKKRTAYAQSDQAFDPKNQALWPAIIEKAYAKWKGGYDVIGKGGQSSKAMEAITGVKSVSAAMPKVDDVVATFSQWQTENKAVVCGTRDWIQQTSKTGLLAGGGDGPYRGSLTDEQGKAAEIVKGTVYIKDSKGKGGTAADDKKGKLSGASVDTGSVAYDTGATALSYKQGLGPGSPEDLEASYRYEGALNQGLNVHGDHAYMFRGVKDGKLLFHNPWGPAAHKHPQPVSAAEFLAYFETIAVNATLPKKNP